MDTKTAPPNCGLILRDCKEGKYYGALNNKNIVFYKYDRRDLKTTPLKIVSAPKQCSDYFTLTVVAFGDHFRIYVDDKLVLEHTDSFLSAGNVGIHVYNKCEVSNVQIMDAPRRAKTIDDLVQLANNAAVPGK